MLTSSRRSLLLLLLVAGTLYQIAGQGSGNRIRLKQVREIHRNTSFSDAPKLMDGDSTSCSQNHRNKWDFFFDNATVGWVRIVAPPDSDLSSLKLTSGRPMTTAKDRGSPSIMDWVFDGGLTTYTLLLLSDSAVRLCEIEVYKGSVANVAANKSATQSSTFDGTDIYQSPPLTFRASAALAVDGANTKNYSEKTCAVTDWSKERSYTDNPWWQVDLGGQYDVMRVDIYQRGDGETNATNRGPLRVRVGDHVEGPENRSVYYGRPVVSVPLSPPVTASTVNISIPGCSILQLCEVEVFAVRSAAARPRCSSSTCKNGGSCQEGANNFICTCAPGYTGVTCQTAAAARPRCSSSTCKNGGSCQEGANNFICTCAPGYTGVTCQTDVDECASSPCQHGGTCTDGVNSYNCTCVPGYTGVNCQTVSSNGATFAAIGAAAAVILVIVIAIVVIVKVGQRVQCRRSRSLRPGLGAAEQGAGQAHENLVYYNNATASTAVVSRTEITAAQLLSVVLSARKDLSRFQKEFALLPKGLQLPHDVGANSNNRVKNRYKNICAYDHSRVILSRVDGDPHSDYVNANYIDGHRKSRDYIAAQGPTDRSVEDFLRMLWEIGVRKVVMLTLPQEGRKVKCVQYWDDEQEVTFGNFKVKVSDVNVRRDVTTRRLSIKPQNGGSRTVTHFLYTEWPDKDVPESPWQLVDFRSKVLTTSGYAKMPIVVHCSAGVGRTGTLIALDILLRQLAEEEAMDVYNTVWTLRQNRVDMVQTQAQYVFLHEAALVGQCCAGRVVPLEIFPSDPVANDKSMIEKEFQALTQCTIQLTPAVTSLGRMTGNRPANRDQDIIPPDDFIPYLRESVPNLSDYINAVFVPSYQEEKRYIITQTPLPKTVINFWRCVLEHRVKIIVTLDQTNPDVEAEVGEFVPQSQSPASYGPITVTPEEQEENQHFTVNTFNVVRDGSAVRVQQCVARAWTEEEATPSSPVPLLSLAQLVLSRAPPGAGPILVHCRNGAMRSSLYVALSAVLERIDSDAEVAIPYAVGVLKTLRPQAVPFKEQYAFLYEAMLTHVDSVLTYQNCPKVKPGTSAAGDELEDDDDDDDDE